MTNSPLHNFFSTLPLSEMYETASRIVCRTGASRFERQDHVWVRVNRFEGRSLSDFTYVTPAIEKIQPSRGPKSGGEKPDVVGLLFVVIEFFLLPLLLLLWTVNACCWSSLDSRGRTVIVVGCVVQFDIFVHVAAVYFCPSVWVGGLTGCFVIGDCVIIVLKFKNTIDEY